MKRLANIVFPTLLKFIFCKQLENRIINGVPALIEQFPYIGSLAKLGQEGELKHNCGCSIVSQIVGVTAAHCIARYENAHLNTDKVVAHVGSTYSDKGGEIVNILRWHKHPKFNISGQIDYDVAVVIFKRPLRFSSKIQPISLPNRNAEIQVGTMARISGWGVRNGKSRTLSRVLQTAQVPYVSFNSCNKLYTARGYWELRKEQICFGYEEERSGQKDSCLGDSGGPLVINGTLCGIVSWGYLCGEEEPGVYTKVSDENVFDFIAEHTDLYN